MIVLKKAGYTQEFNINKIGIAVGLAEDRCISKIKDSDKEYFYSSIKKEMKNKSCIFVEDLQEIIISKLKEINVEVSEEYSKYRDYKKRFRNTFSNIIDETKNILSRGDDENANKDSKLISTQKELVSGVVSRTMCLEYELDKNWAEAHKDGAIQIHDLTDYIYNSFNCCLFDMGGLLKDGFEINGIKKKEPNSIRTAISVMSDVILSASSQQFGGFTVPEIDSVLAPYVEKSRNKYREMLYSYPLNKKISEELVEELIRADILQGIESVEHRLNTINNSNGQTSFTTFSFGLDMREDARMISRAILDVRKNGLGSNNITAIFPKLVFLVRDEINKNDFSHNHDLYLYAIEVSMKRMYPDYLSLNNGYLGEVFDKYGEVISPMGCRSYLSIYEKDGKGVFTGRANCGVVSLNLVQYAIRSNGDITKFYELLDSYIKMAIDIHLYKFEKLRKQKASSNPLFFTQGGCHMKLNPNDCIEEVIRTFTWSIGFIGLDEVTRFFTGNGIDKDSTLAENILDYMNVVIDEYKDELGLMFSLYGTPAESMCYRMLKLDRDKYGVIEGITDKSYYTNSFHIWVREKINGIEKQNIEMKLFDKCKGGRIIYNEYPHTKNKLAIKQSIDNAMDLGAYKGINLQLDSCLDCNESGEFKDDVCSKCGSSNILQINRTCGYLGVKNRMNKGKQAEINERVDHYEI